jgi:hypothetical protein
MFLQQELCLLRYDVETSSILAFAATIPQKTKSAAENSVRFGKSTSLRKALGVPTSILSISESLKRQREVFCRGLRPTDTVRRTASVGSVGSATGAGHPAIYQHKPTYRY